MSRAAFREVDIVPRQDTGNIDAHYPSGVVPSNTFAVSTIPDIVTITAQQTYAEDFSGYITGAAGWTATFLPVTGTLAGVGLSASGSTYAPEMVQHFQTCFERPVPGNQTILSGVTVAGSVFLQLRVQKGTEIHLSNIFQRTVIQTADTTGPTTGEGLLIAVTGTTAMITGDWPSDPTTPGILASGIARVYVENSVDGTAFSALPPLVPANLGASPPLVSTLIGAPAGTNTATQTAQKLAFSAGGGLFGASTDTCIALGAQMQGDYELSAFLSSFTSAYGFSDVSIMVRGDTSPGAAFLRIARRPSASGNPLVMVWRPPGATATQFFNAADPAPGSDLLCKIVKSGNSYTCLYWSANQWNTIGQATVAMGQTTYALGASATNTTAITISTYCDQFDINILGQFTATNTLPAPTSYYRFRAQDASGNFGGYSPTATANTTGPGSVKNNRGHYIASFNVNGTGTNNPAEFSALGSARAAGAPILGILDQYTWSEIETAFGVYNIAATLVADFNDCQGRAPGAHWAYCVNPRQFGLHLQLASHVSGPIPAYILADPGTYGSGTNGTQGGYTLATWSSANSEFTEVAARTDRASVMNRYIACHAAIAAFSFTTTAGPYAGQTFTFDTHPQVENVFIGEESAVDVTNLSGAWSYPNYQLTLQSLYAGLTAANPHTQCASELNYTGTQASVLGFVNDAYVAGMAMGGPDLSALAHISWAQAIVQGKRWNPATASFSGSGTPYVGLMPQTPWLQQIDYNQSGVTLAQFFATAQSLGSEKIYWGYINNSNSVGDFTTKLVPFIKANPLT